MEKDMFQDLTPDARRAALENGCYKKEHGTINRPFTDEEITDLKDNLSEKSVTVAEIEAKKKLAVAAFDAELKPLKGDVKQTVKHLRDKFEKVESDIYLFDNQEEGIMETYDANGKFISSRRLFPDERQTAIHRNMDSTGTNG